VTVRRRVLARRATAAEKLGVNVELWAASLLAGFWVVEGMRTRRWWRQFAEIHGERIEAKVRQRVPGTRPGWWYACGRLPPVPLVGAEPEASTGWGRHCLEIEGVKHWRLGEGWQLCQAKHLQALGELDGEELRRYRAWRRAGFPQEYRTDRFPDRPGQYFFHGCYS
jgi:hypothetical protein